MAFAWAGLGRCVVCLLALGWLGCGDTGDNGSPGTTGGDGDRTGGMEDGGASGDGDHAGDGDAPGDGDDAGDGDRAGDGDAPGDGDDAGDGDLAGDGDSAGDGDDATRTNDPYPGYCSWRIDDDADGGFDTAYFNSFDADGIRTAHRTDYDADGVIDSVRTFTYDEAGNMLVNAHDSDADGMVDARYTHTFTADGQPLRDVDYRGDTVTRTRDRVYDGDGRLLSVTENQQPDGYGHSRLTYGYDAQGCLASVAQDDPHDDVIDIFSLYASDDACRTVRREIDYGNDGEIDVTLEFEYDGDGNETLERRRDGTGEVTSETRHTYEGGLRVMTEHNPGAKFTIYERDPAGNLLAEIVESRGDMAPILRSRIDFELDARGNPLRRIYDRDGDGVTDRIEVYTYDCWTP